jgi:hypothetical protein
MKIDAQLNTPVEPDSDLLVNNARIGVHFMGDVLIVAGGLNPVVEESPVARCVQSIERIRALTAEMHIMLPGVSPARASDLRISWA